jgi:hypothetical protein
VSRLHIGNAEVYGKVVQSSLGPRVYDVFARYSTVEPGATVLELTRIGQVYRAPGGTHAVGHWRNTRTEAGYRTKWAAMLYLYNAWLTAGVEPHIAQLIGDVHDVYCI